MTTNSFQADLTFDEIRIKTKVIIETSFSKEIRILMATGQSIKEHQTPFPILIHLIDGQIELGIKGKTQILNAGNIVGLEGGIPHNLNALEDSVIRLTISKQDSAIRVENIANS